jgi:thiol-disulfide isomerase/thioredoxin
MAENQTGPTGPGTSKVPPRPGTRPSASGRPTVRLSTTPAPGRPGRAVARGTTRQLAQRHQRNMYIVSGTTAVVVVVIGAIVAFSLGGNGNGGSPPKTTRAGQPLAGTFSVSPALVNKVENVGLTTLVSAAAAAKNGATPAFGLPSGTALLTVDGKPEILFMGAEWCPYCAAERWSLLMALSKFGTFGPLRGTTSSSSDTNASTPTFSFYNADYKSKYISFVPVEEETATEAKLQAPTAAQTALFDKWDAPPYVSAQQAGAIPFIYFDGKYLLIGAQYDASPIAGMPFTSAVPYMTSGANATSTGAEASAGYVVGDICALTHDQPASVCGHVPAKLVGISLTKAKS